MMGTRQRGTTNDDDEGGNGHFSVNVGDVEGGGADRDEDGQKEDGKKKEEEAKEKRLIQKPLPERVCELFLMQDFNGGQPSSTTADSRPFFRSAFMRERLPQMLFSNGASGLDGNAGSGVIRNIPIKVLGGGDGNGQKKHPSREEATNLNHTSNGRMAGSVLEMDNRADDFIGSPSTPPTAVDRFSLMSSPELRRHFASLFWTPQQARRIAEREEGRQQKDREYFGINRNGEDSDGGGSGRFDRGLGGGSSVTVYSIPITNSESREEIGTQRMEDKNEQKQSTAEGGPYSAIPFRRRIGMNSALSTPSLYANELNNNNNNNNSPLNEKPPTAPLLSATRNSTSSNKPTSFPATQNNKNHNPQTTPNQSQLPIRRTQTAFSLPQQELPRRDSEPSILLAEDAQRRLNVASSMSHLNNHPKSQQYSGESSATISDDSGSIISTSTSSSATTTEMPRSKSPSLLSLRQSLLRLRPSRRNGNGPISGHSSLLPACVRSRQSSGSDQGEEEEERAAQSDSRDSNQKQQRMIPTRNSTSNPSLNASCLRLTEFVPRQTTERRGGRTSGGEKSVDAVEEAIRSLEQFDPSDFVQRQYGGADRRPSAPSFPSTRSAHSAAPRGVFLAKAEPVPIRQPHQFTSIHSNSLLASSLPSERRSSLTFCSPISSSSSPASSTSSGDPSPSFPPSAFHQPLLPRRPSNATISSGSATPTQQIVGGGPHSTQFGHSTDFDSNRTPRANSPTENGNEYQNDGMPEMDRLIGRLKGHQRRRGVTFNDEPTQHFYSPFDGPPPDYSESGSDGRDEEDEANGSLVDSEDGDSRNAAALEAEAQLRKRFLCSQLTDCAKVIEINAMKMGQFVATGSGLGGWRQPHILRHNLGAIRDTIYTVEFALDELVESLCRVSLDPRDPRRAHMQQLAKPVQTSLTMLRKLRASLDSTGWSLATLGRPRENFAVGHDALDQLVAILPQLPKDCLKLVQWIYSLSVWPDPRSFRPAAAFLPASASSTFRPTLHPPPPPPAPNPAQNGFSNNQPRPPSPTSSLQNYYSSGEDEPQREKTNGEAKGNNITEVMDGGESTSSTTSSVQTLLESEMMNGGGNGRQHQQTANGQIKEADGGGGMVLEEDDLASVISDGHWPDHASLHSPLGPSSLNRRVNAELSRSLSPDQREIFRLYEPQVDGHITAMCSMIEEFFSLVESNKEPKLSFQKIQMIYIEGHSLCGIIRVLSRDDSISHHRPLSAFLHHECAKLDSLLNECLASAKVAKTKAQNWSRAQTVPAVQTMCQSVVSVSECANQLRGFWASCA